MKIYEVNDRSSKYTTGNKRWGKLAQKVGYED